MKLGFLGSPTNSGSTCAASNTQEESLPKVLLLMVAVVVVVVAQPYGQKNMLNWLVKVLLLSCPLRIFSEHSTEDNQEQGAKELVCFGRTIKCIFCGDLTLHELNWGQFFQK